MGWVATVTFLQYGRRFQRHRRLLQDYLNRKKCIAHRTVQTREARMLLQNLLSNDARREDFLRRFATAIIMHVAYGHRITSDDDTYLRIAQENSHANSNSGPPGNTPVDFFPFLQYLPSWFPGTYYARFARENRRYVDALHHYPLADVQKQKAEGIEKPSFLAHQLEILSCAEDDTCGRLNDINGAAAVMYCAGADTTGTTLSIFFLAMVLHPEFQVKAQEEIDAVVGTDRLPEFADRDSLPYVECVLQETLRWNSAVPLGVPHRSLQDDIYKGMFIPKGSLIVANTRGMTLDETVYANPVAFNPARFLPSPAGNGEPHPRGPFGFGRRICPGRHLADSSVWIAIASILAALTISKAVDDVGVVVTPEVAFTSGITGHPHPYKCCIRPRNRKAQVLVARADTWDNN